MSTARFILLFTRFLNYYRTENAKVRNSILVHAMGKSNKIISIVLCFMSVSPINTFLISKCSGLEQKFYLTNKSKIATD